MQATKPPRLTTAKRVASVAQGLDDAMDSWDVKYAAAETAEPSAVKAGKIVTNCAMVRQR